MPDQAKRTMTSSFGEIESPASLSDYDAEYDAEKQLSDNLDIRNSWRSKVKWRLLSISPLLAISAVVVPTALCFRESVRNQSPFGCDPAGNVWVAGGKPSDKLSLWNLAYTLSPTITLWKTRFTKAKAADLCWDVIVGRCFSTLSALLVYNVFRVVLADIMKYNPLTQDQLLAAQYSTTSVHGLSIYLKGYIPWLRRSGRRSTLWTCVTTFQLTLLVIYVLVTPTWLSAMTSYQATTHPVLKVDNNYTPLNNLISCRFRILDGHRVGLSDNFCVHTTGSLHDAVQKYIQSHPVVWCYGDVKASFNTAYLPRKTCDFNSTFENDGQAVPLASPVLSIGGIEYAYNNHTIDASSLQSRSICQSSQSGEYEWGVSFILLFSFMVVTVVLMLSIFLTWLKFHDRIWPQQVDLVFGNMRTALMVGTSVRNALGDKVDDMSENDIKKCLSRLDCGVQQKHTQSEIMSIAGPCEKREREREKKHERWCEEQCKKEREGKCEKKYRIPVGSEAYKNYIVHGYSSLLEAGLELHTGGGLDSTTSSRSI